MKYITLQTSDISSVKPLITKLYIPKNDSHKGQNGKVMIIGGSSLFHSAVIWSAETASYFVDMVHFASTMENNEIMTEIKKIWQGGIVVNPNEISTYIKEDDAILLGTGMMRSGTEGKLTHHMTKLWLEKHPDKRWVIDAGALQVMDKDWLLKLNKKPIVTPHQKEFKMLFGTELSFLPKEKIIEKVVETAKKFKCIILLKAGYDIISDGITTYLMIGGNAGLTKGGTGDILAGLITALFTKNNGLNAATLSSFILKLTAEKLYEEKGLWYSNKDIISALPNTLSWLLRQYKIIT